MIIEALMSFLDTSRLGWASLLGLAAVIFIGLPHGAFDGAVAMALGWAKRPWMMLAFIGGYIGLAALVVIFWLAFPDIALLAFLGISLIHFGLGDAITGKGIALLVQTIAHGGMVIGGISLFHKAEVDIIYSYLTGGDTELIWIYIEQSSIVIGLALCIYLALAIMRPALRPRLFEIVCLGFIFYMLPPLAGFAFYFCMVHTPRHLFRIWRQLGRQNFSPRSMMIMAAGFSFASWLAAGIALWMMPSSMSADAQLLRVIFIGLAALTVPHMMLVDGLFRRHQPSIRGIADIMPTTDISFKSDSGQDNLPQDNKPQDNKPQGHNDA